ncbi:MAG: murein biosynthesis integral membrane protein MurJ [Chloroflexia bacterium]
MSSEIADPQVEPTAASAAPTALQSAARRGIASAALIITVGNLLSRLFGLVREQLAAHYFGTEAVKPFALADSMLTILYDLLISGMVAAALVPVLTEYAAPERRAELRRIVGTLLTLATLALGGVTTLLVIFAPQLVTVWLKSGSGSINDALIPEAIRNVRLILPAVLLLSFSAILLATNYALGRFAWPSVAQAARNGAIIIATILLVRVLGVTSMVVGVLIGGFLLVALQLPGLRDALPIPGLALRHPAIRRIFRLYAPIFIGLLANTIGQLIDRNLASGRAGDDALGAMRYATTLQQLVLGLVATGISLGALPALSRQAESGDEASFRATLTAALRLTTVLIAPASLGLLALAAPIVNLLFRHGATNAVGAAAIVLALVWYIPGTFCQAYDQLLINVFYARRNTLTPQLVGVAAVVLYIAVELTLVGRFGMVALVGAISVQWTFHAAVMYWLARHLLTPADHRAFARVLAVCLGVGAIMAAIAWGSSTLLSRTLPGPTLIRELLTLAIPVALGAAFYAWGITRLGIDDFAVLARRVVARVRR